MRITESSDPPKAKNPPASGALPRFGNGARELISKHGPKVTKAMNELRNAAGKVPKGVVTMAKFGSTFHPVGLAARCAMMDMPPPRPATAKELANPKHPDHFKGSDAPKTPTPTPGPAPRGH